jgi:hypothetical protein
MVWMLLILTKLAIEYYSIVYEFLHHTTLHDANTGTERLHMHRVDISRTHCPMIRTVRIKKVITCIDNFLSLLLFETTRLPS